MDRWGVAALVFAIAAIVVVAVWLMNGQVVLIEGAHTPYVGASPLP